MRARVKTGVPEKTRRPTASSGTIPTCDNPVTQLGIEPGLPWWEASMLIAQAPWPRTLKPEVFADLFRVKLESNNSLAQVTIAIGPSVIQHLVKNPEPIRNTRQNEGPTVAFRCDSNQPMTIFICLIVHNTVQSSLRAIEPHKEEPIAFPREMLSLVWYSRRPGIVPGSRWWEACMLTAQPPRHPLVKVSQDKQPSGRLHGRPGVDLHSFPFVQTIVFEIVSLQTSVFLSPLAKQAYYVYLNRRRFSIGCYVYVESRPFLQNCTLLAHTVVKCSFIGVEIPGACQIRVWSNDKRIAKAPQATANNSTPQKGWESLSANHNTPPEGGIICFPATHYVPPTNTYAGAHAVGSRSPRESAWSETLVARLRGGEFSSGARLLQTRVQRPAWTFQELQTLAVKIAQRIDAMRFGAAVAEQSACSPPTKAIRVQYPAGSQDFRMWESCRTMPLVGGFPRGSPVSPALSFWCRFILTSITLVGSQDFASRVGDVADGATGPGLAGSRVCLCELCNNGRPTRSPPNNRPDNKSAVLHTLSSVLPAIQAMNSRLRRISATGQQERRFAHSLVRASSDGHLALQCQYTIQPFNALIFVSRVNCCMCEKKFLCNRRVECGANIQLCGKRESKRPAEMVFLKWWINAKQCSRQVVRKSALSKDNSETALGLGRICRRACAEWVVVALEASPARLACSLGPLVHTVFDTWRTLAQSSPSTVTADNQCAVDIGIFVHKTVESSMQVSRCLFSAVHTQSTQQELVTRVEPGVTEYTAATHERATKDEVDRSRWLRTTSLRVPTLNCFPANTT
ncbi:hypothetical protein PR048_022841 [Dryococelus australis]|uniref:Uncharacterized protein n=1 Tax=Dryococelus australis TaxID=614101 RepID=A0ABQ9GSC7_9NEOP|nr:hypothetical protein PR048_022841 [Dryococelus australis]